MRIKEFEPFVARRSGLSPSQVDLLARNLRASHPQYLPTGGRGPHSPLLTAESAAVLLLAAAQYEGIESAVMSVANADRLFPDGRDGKSLMAMLTDVLSDSERCRAIEKIVIRRPYFGSEATVTRIKGRKTKQETYRPRRTDDQSGVPMMRVDATISGDLLTEVAEMLARDKK